MAVSGVRRDNAFLPPFNLKMSPNAVQTDALGGLAML
jgi:hypothetical protein